MSPQFLIPVGYCWMHVFAVHWDPLLLSLRVAVFATVLTLFAGTGLALLLSWRKLPAADFFDAVVSALPQMFGAPPPPHVSVGSGQGGQSRVPPQPFGAEPHSMPS